MKIKPEEALKASPKSKGDCSVCNESVSELPSITVTVTVFFKKMSTGACLKCAREIRDLIDLRISEASNVPRS